MGFFRDIIPFRKKVRPVGKNLESGREDGISAEKKNLITKASIFVLLAVVTMLAFPRVELYEYAVNVGDFWRYEAVEAPLDFAVFKEPEVIEEERASIRSTTPPFFLEIPDSRQKMQAKRDTVSQQLRRILDTYASSRINRANGLLDEAVRDSLAYLDMRRNARLVIPRSQWQRLQEDYIKRIPELLPLEETPPNTPPLYEELLKRAWDVGLQLMNVGIMDIPVDSVQADEIQIRDERASIVRTRKKENVFGSDEAGEFALNEFEQAYPNDPELANIGEAFFQAIYQNSLQYLRADSVREWQRQEQGISPTRGKIVAGTVIVRNGERVTSEIKRQLSSLERVQRERRGRKLPWKIAAGQLILTLATYGFFFLYLFVLRRQIFDENKNIMLITLLFIGVIAGFAWTIRYPAFGIYVVPVTIVPLMLTVMFDSRVALFGNMTLAIIGGHLLGYDFEYTFATIIAGTLVIFSVRDIKNRGQIFLSAAFAFVGYTIVLTATWLMYDTAIEVFLQDITRIAIGAVLLIASLPLLWAFERAFDVTTDLTLLELSDTNRSLLKELSMKASGTFNHTLQVANLAEAAADAIGANALLARVGALYHDIGKISKPEYFVENQHSGENPHDQLKPRMSALIIASHVKEGLEIGRQRQHRLPARVLDFISTHHGNSLIEFFYRKAVELSDNDQDAVSEAEFRYPGPLPFSKETGILMLADSVEAASRSLGEPTHKRLETLVDNLFNARIAGGQLDNADLTFKELNTIKDTFMSILLGIYHVRVKYPGQEEEERKAMAEEEGGEPQDGPRPSEEKKRALSVNGGNGSPPAEEAKAESAGE